MKRAIALAVLFGVVGLAISLWLLGENLSSVTRLPLWALALGVVLVAVNYLAGAVRLYLLSAMVDHPVTLPGALRAYALGLFSASLTPGNAGQAPAVVLSFTTDGMPASRAWSVNLYVWVLDLVLLAYSLPVSLLVLGRSTRLLPFGSPWLLAAIAAAAALTMLWLLLYRLSWLVRLAKGLFRIRWLRRWRASVSEFLGRFEAATGDLLKGSPGQRFTLHLLTALVYFSTLFTFYVMVASMRPDVSLVLTLAVAQVPTVLATFFPTPGGAGLLEIFTASLMLAGSGSGPADSAGGAGLADQAGVDGDTRGTIAAAILGWRLLTYYSRFLVAPALGAARLGVSGRGGSDSGSPRHDPALDELQERG